MISSIQKFLNISNHDLKLSLHNFNIEEQINNINPSLWMFIKSITRTMKQRVGVPDESEDILVKKLRQYYIICLILYCTNIQTPTAIHILLAETIEMCGGSQRLMKLCNGCRKGGHSCGPACSCQNGTNVLQLHGGNDINTAVNTTTSSPDTNESDSYSGSDDSEEEIEEIIFPEFYDEQNSFNL